MAYQLQEINRRIKTDVTEFLEECDQAYAQRVSLAADRILSNLDKSPVVLLSGPSGSGKTTTAMKIAEEPPAPGCQYPRGGYGQLLQEPEPQDRAPQPPRETSTTNLPSAWIWSCWTSTSPALSRGEEIIIPKFEFARQMRNDARGTPLKLGKNEIAIFEGIHALNDDIAGPHPEAAKLYISARSNVNDGAALRFKGTWMRLTRRAVRDYSFRGTGVADTLEMWANVRRGVEAVYLPL